jgi:ABC-type Zn uptake system ZnuABC Zn-binding protein ZnuA
MVKHRPTWRAVLGTVAAGILLAAGLGGCSKPPEAWPEGKKPRILVSFAPLYCFAANVAGPDAVVLSLLTTTGPHDYQATAQDAIKLQRADVFFINGLGLDDTFATTLKNSTGRPGLEFVELGEGLPHLIREEAHDHHEHAGHSHSHGEYDPHVWLGIPEAVAMVNRIRDTLKKIDPGQAARYDQNAAAYVQRLQKLQADGREMLAGKKNRNVIAFHESLNYFARSFGLNIVGTIQERAGVDPAAGRLPDLVKLCREKGVRVIASEPQYQDNTVVETLRREVGPDVKVVKIDPLEAVAQGGELRPGYYEDVLRENLRKLHENLE